MTRGRLSAPLTLTSLLLILSVTGCAGSTKGTTDTSCISFEPITYSPQDTEDTVNQIVEYDVKWDRLCKR